MKWAWLLFCFLVTAYAAAAADKPDLSGTWQRESAAEKKDGGTSWLIEQNGSEIRLRELDASGKTRSDIKCGTMGAECPAKIDGESAKVTYYFNGPTLVELVWKGKEVIKTRRTLSSDGTRLMVEVMPMTPPRDPEKLVFVRSTKLATR